MSRTMWVMSAAFIVTLGAGVVVGLLGAKIPDAREPHSWLKDELQLTDQQSDKMKSIWTEAWSARQDLSEKRRAAEKQRTDSVVALLSADQKTKYDQIDQQFAQETLDFNRQRDEIMNAATEKTRQLLTPEQRAKYDANREKHKNDHGPGRGPGGPGMGPGPGMGAGGSGHGPHGGPDDMDRPPISGAASASQPTTRG